MTTSGVEQTRTLLEAIDKEAKSPILFIRFECDYDWENPHPPIDELIPWQKGREWLASLEYVDDYSQGYDWPNYAHDWVAWSETEFITMYPYDGYHLMVLDRHPVPGAVKSAVSRGGKT